MRETCSMHSNKYVGIVRYLKKTNKQTSNKTIVMIITRMTMKKMIKMIIMMTTIGRVIIKIFFQSTSICKVLRFFSVVAFLPLGS